MPDRVILGRDTLTDDAVYLRDSQRTDGLWIIGKPGIGKSTLLLHLLQHDIAAGHGLFFLDPHWDLTTELLKRIDRSAQDKILLFDPMNETHTFCINPLSCPDPTSLRQRTEAFIRTYPILKRFLTDNLSNTQDFLAGLPKTPRVKLLLENIIHVFLENQDYTLIDLLTFLTNQQFREYLLHNVRYQPEAVRFWTEQFPKNEAALIAARAHHLFTNPMVAHVIGHAETTVDFPRFLAEGKIILVAFSKTLASEHKICISTLLLSELLATVKRRYERQGNQFSIYINELHEVPDPEDFMVLFPQAKDFGITTTFAANELREEFRTTFPIRGSLTAAANIFFQLTVKDARELAPELIQEPPSPEQVITTTPIEHIWEHGLPLDQVQRYRAKYFWLVGLLQSQSQDQYFTFDPARYPALQSTNNPYFPNRGYYVDLEYYRSSANMLREGINLLNDYYYQAMTGHIDFSKPPSEDQLDLFIRILDLFAGVLGFYQTMSPFVISQNLGKSLNLNKEFYFLGLDFYFLGLDIELWKRPNIANFIRKHGLPDQLLAWRFDQPWKSNKENTKAREILCELVRRHVHSAFTGDDGKLHGKAERAKLQKEYMDYSLTVYESLLKDAELGKIYPEYLEKGRQRISWQLTEIGDFVEHIFCLCPQYLSTAPIFEPRRLHGLARDLSLLPHFTAYLKTSVQVEEKCIVNRQKFRALPLREAAASASDMGKKRQHVSFLAIFMQTLPYLYPRDLLDAEIQERREP